MAVLKTFQPCIFTALQYDRVTLNKSKVLLRHRDIHFLLADKALNDIDPNQVKQFIEPLSLPSDNLDAQFDDEQLSAFCRSRYIQQPSDIDNYVNALNNFSNQLSDYAKNFRRGREDSSASVSSSSILGDSKKAKEDTTADN